MHKVLYIPGGAGFLPSTVAMEHGPFEDIFPIGNGDFPLPC